MKSQIHNYFKNKSILITGGTGTIGSALLLKLLQTDCKVIRVLSNDENGLFDLSEKVKILSKSNISQNFFKNMRETRVRYFLGDVRDLERCMEIT